MLNVIFIVGVIALRHLPTLLNVDVDVDGCYILAGFYLEFIVWGRSPVLR